MRKYVVSLVFQKVVVQSVSSKLLVEIVEAVSLEEAFGKAYLLCTRKLSGSESWTLAMDVVSEIGLTATLESFPSIRLNEVEIQSNHSRVNHAESLILQLPKEHDGRNTWLLNYGTRIEANTMREVRKIKWNELTQSAETIN